MALRGADGRFAANIVYLRRIAASSAA